MRVPVDDDDVIFHSLFIGSTGAGKTNALLYWLRRLFVERRDVALVLIDPHGDAAIDLFRSIPKSERERVILLDPNYVSFGLNPLSLPPGLEGPARTQTIQTQVEQLSVLLSDVFSTDASTAPRLMWIFKGALYYLYTLDDRPTFKDLYRILVDFISMPKEQISVMLKSSEIKDEIIESTMEAISKLPKEAFASVVNRISNFTLPPQSITSRTFCSRTSKLDFEEMMTPGKLTIFRLPKSLPHDFRRLLSASVVMRFYFAMEKRASRLEAAGEEPSARTPVILAMDEFQNISDLKLLDTILSESRKYGLYLWMV
ncbi:MAG: type IV secretory system conjugative DNA transfer family protein, partial [Nitrososphaerota archaeon]|nr:type IV secretory system conjugative DNA transfer family protein [Nitrososphaerota archaeon]